MVYGLKLIWRMLTVDLLWGKWIKGNLLKKKFFWEISENTQAGLWIWRKLLKLREVAKTFYMKAVCNRRHTSFWYDKWSDLGVISELLGERGVIDLGIRKGATVEEALNNSHRRRRHRGVLLNDVEKVLGNIAEKLRDTVSNTDLWRRSSGFKPKFSTSETWQLTRVRGPLCLWSKSIWFAHSTLKFAFITCLASQDRLATLNRIASWGQNIDSTCVLCYNATETRNHLFF